MSIELYFDEIEYYKKYSRGGKAAYREEAITKKIVRTLDYEHQKEKFYV